MPWERRWVPPGPPPGAPPWLPLAPVGGYWTDIYVPTPDEREAASLSAGASAQREQERAKDAEAASAQLEKASGLTDVRGAFATHDPELFSEAASLHAWRIIVASDAIPPTHDLVHWKARHREFEFWFQWLPDLVIRERGREPLWLVEDQVWTTAAGSKYRPVENSYDREWPFGVNSSKSNAIALPHGAGFTPLARRPSDRARPRYCLSTGQPVELRGTNPAYIHVNGSDLKRLLSH
jgi:hypothetical protein